MEWVVQEPQFESDWQQYFECRWRILRAAWHQPRGSERDELDILAHNDTQFSQKSLPIRHLMVKNDSGHVIAVARMHPLQAQEAQIRYMAVDQHYRRRGLASKMLQYLENLAGPCPGTRIVVNARSSAQVFYAKHGYETVGPGELLFNQIEHVRMYKYLS